MAKYFWAHAEFAYFCLLQIMLVIYFKAWKPKINEESLSTTY